jgi:F-type H+-transporting ATPase subunit delta
MAELVSKTYSEAIFEVALEEGRLEALQSEFALIESTLKAYPEFYEILKTPNKY